MITQLRSAIKDSPVIILNAKHSVADRVKGLQTGSDDYLVQPFAFAELLAWVQALIRRSSGAASPTRLEAGDLLLDLLTREVFRVGKILQSLN